MEIIIVLALIIIAMLMIRARFKQIDEKLDWDKEVLDALRDKYK